MNKKLTICIMLTVVVTSFLACADEQKIEEPLIEIAKEDTVSDNTVSSDTLSENTVSEDTISENSIENIYIYDIEEGYVLVPYQEDLPKNQVNYNNGTSHGIDVSKFQGDIRWDEVAKEGIDFAMIRVGNRGYETGKVVIDDRFIENIEGASREGIPVGVYFYSQALNEEEAIEEAKFVLEQIAPYNVTFPVVIDSEKVKNASYRSENLSKEERTNCIITFCEEVKKAGYEPMIYANALWFTTALELERLTEYQIWYADYMAEPIYPYWIDMWQYTESGRINGIDGNVDFNVYFH